VQCEVIAPSLVPMKSGDRIKTDRRDAERLAWSYQAGDLTAVWVADSQHEALRDLVREATKEDPLRAKHRLLKYLLRYGPRPADDGRSWTAAWWQWVRALTLAHPEQNATLLELILEVDHQGQRIARFDAAIDQAVDAAPEQLRAIVDGLQALRGVAKVTAVTLATEFGCFSRFEKAGQVMSYTGMVPSEHSVPQDSAWRYHQDGQLASATRARGVRLALPASAKALQAPERASELAAAEGCSHRLERPTTAASPLLALQNKSKSSAKIVTALARELAGFVWAIGVETERALNLGKAA